MKTPRMMVMAATLAVCALGCGDKRDPAAATGEAPIIATPSADPRADMRGRWTIDPERLGEQPSLAAMPAEQRQLALEMSRNLLASMTVRFDEARYAMTISGKAVEGAYTIVAQEGPDLTLELREDGAEAPERVTLRVDSRGLVLTSGEDVLPLRRKADAEPAPTPSGEGPATAR